MYHHMTEYRSISISGGTGGARIPGRRGTPSSRVPPTILRYKVPRLREAVDGEVRMSYRFSTWARNATDT